MRTFTLVLLLTIVTIITSAQSSDKPLVVSCKTAASATTFQQLTGTPEGAYADIKSFSTTYFEEGKADVTTSNGGSKLPITLSFMAQRCAKYGGKLKVMFSSIVTTTGKRYPDLYVIVTNDPKPASP